MTKENIVSLVQFLFIDKLLVQRTQLSWAIIAKLGKLTSRFYSYNHVQPWLWAFETRGMFGVHNIFVKPVLRLKPCLVVVIWNSDFAVNDVHWTFSPTTRFLPTPDFPLYKISLGFFRLIINFPPTIREFPVWFSLISPEKKHNIKKKSSSYLLFEQHLNYKL